MPIKECRAADVPTTSREILGLRVLVMRKWPRMRGINKNTIDIWLPDAGPSLALLELYRKGSIDWATFAERYKAEQRAATSCRVVEYAKGVKVRDEVLQRSSLAHLRALEWAFGVVTIICWEDTEHQEVKKCHRHLLVDLANEEVVHA